MTIQVLIKNHHVQHSFAIFNNKFIINESCMLCAKLEKISESIDVRYEKDINLTEPSTKLIEMQLVRIDREIN